MTMFIRNMNKESTRSINEVQNFLMFAEVINGISKWDDMVKLIEYQIDPMHQKRFGGMNITSVIKHIFIDQKPVKKLVDEFGVTMNRAQSSVNRCRTFVYHSLINETLKNIFNENERKEVCNLIRDYVSRNIAPDDFFKRTYHKYLWANGNPFSFNPEDMTLQISKNTVIDNYQAKRLMMILNYRGDDQC